MWPMKVHRENPKFQFKINDKNYWKIRPFNPKNKSTANLVYDYWFLIRG